MYVKCLYVNRMFVNCVYVNCVCGCVECRNVNCVYVNCVYVNLCVFCLCWCVGLKDSSIDCMCWVGIIYILKYMFFNVSYTICFNSLKSCWCPHLKVATNQFAVSASEWNNIMNYYLSADLTISFNGSFFFVASLFARKENNSNLVSSVNNTF